MRTDIRTLVRIFLPAFLVRLALVCTCVGGGTVNVLSLIVVLRFVNSNSVLCLLK